MVDACPPMPTHLRRHGNTTPGRWRCYGYLQEDHPVGLGQVNKNTRHRGGDVDAEHLRLLWGSPAPWLPPPGLDHPPQAIRADARRFTYHVIICHLMMLTSGQMQMICHLVSVTCTTWSVKYIPLSHGTYL